MTFTEKRKLWSRFDIKYLNFRPIRYLKEIYGTKCPICYKQMTLPTSKLLGCPKCSFWAHKKCMTLCDKCPQCLRQRFNADIQIISYNN